MKSLEEIYNNSHLITDIANIENNIIHNLINIGEKCFSQKGVYTVTITLLYYKVLHPAQDIRYHQDNMENGFSGRSFDTKFVTPELKRLKLPSMAESGWLTRSLEQPYPYTIEYNGKISGGIKLDFLKVLDYVQQHPSKAEDMLRILLNKVAQVVDNNAVVITPIENSDDITIDDIIIALDFAFNYNYGTHNGAKLPVLAFYAIFTSIIKEVKRYENCYLAPLSSLTACDLTSKSSGDIEIYKDNFVFESIEIKLNKKIDTLIMRVAQEKIYKFNPERYYILSYYGVKENELLDLNNIINEVNVKHGCQVIVNGLLPTIKYYLRLISSLNNFINDFNFLIETDTEIQKIHKEVWNKILKEILCKKQTIECVL